MLRSKYCKKRGHGKMTRSTICKKKSVLPTPPPPTEGFEHLSTQRVTLCTILRHPFLSTDSKKFLKALLAPICTNVEGGACAEKRLFLSKFSKKHLKTHFSALFFKFLPAAHRILPKQIVSVLGRVRKFNLADLKKDRQNFGRFIEILSPPSPSIKF